MIELPIARLREDATIPERAYSGDAGLDLSTCERVELAPGERAVVPTGLAVAIPEGFAGFVQPRSGLAARNGIAVVNSPGLIDSGYRGEIESASAIGPSSGRSSSIPTSSASSRLTASRSVSPPATPPPGSSQYSRPAFS